MSTLRNREPGATAGADAPLFAADPIEASRRGAMRGQSGARHFLATDMPVPLWATAAGFGAALGFGLAASGAEHPTHAAMFLFGAAASGGLGLYGLVERAMLVGRARRLGASRAMARAVEGCPEPCALLDDEGRVVLVNAALTAAANAPLRRLADLTAAAEDPEGVASNLLSRALRDGAANAALRGVDAAARTAALWRVGPDRLMFREGAAPAPIAEPDQGAVGRFTLRPDGRIAEMDAVFERWAGAQSAGATAARLLPDLPLAPIAGAALRSRFSGAAEGPSTVAAVFSEPNALGERTGAVVALAEDAPVDPTTLQGADRLLGAIDAAHTVQLFEDAPVGVAVLTAQSKILRLNPVAARMLSRACGGGNPLGRPLLELLMPDDRLEATRRFDGAETGLSAPERAAFEARLSDGGEETAVVQFFLSAVDTSKGRLMLAYLIDASERRALEDRFLQSQRLQAVGQLAGGVAHDFNNLLTVIIGSSELLLQRRSAEDPDFEDVSAIHQNATRAASLVGQLLAFSRKQTLRPQQVDLSERISDLSFLLRRLIGERVHLALELDDRLWPVRVDPNQFEQVVTNLVVNARDAMKGGGMKGGGRITVTTRNLSFTPEAPAPHPPMPMGDFVHIEVADTGCGIPPDKRDQIFEPFFTTKKVGEGTGLGLSTVYGIVKQTGGFIFVDSEIDVGTTFDIYLPRDATAEAESRPSAQQTPSAKTAPAGALTGAETILLVEDEAPVRKMTAQVLRARGYTVLEADCGEEALEMLSDAGQGVDLLLSDVVMPNMDGPTLVRKVRPSRPDLKTLFMSGYARDALDDVFDGEEGAALGYLQKPFTLDKLAAAVRAQLDG